MRRLFGAVVEKLMRYRIGKILQKLQFQLMVVFLVSLLAYGVATNIANHFFQQVITQAELDYSTGLQQVDGDLQNIVNVIQEPSLLNQYSQPGGPPETVEQYIYTQYQGSGQVFLVDPEGKVLASSARVEQTQVNMSKLFQDATSLPVDAQDYTGGPVVRMSPVTYEKKPAYVVMEATPTPDVIYHQENNPLATVIGLAAFVATFYFLTKRKLRYMQELGNGLNTIATGDLSYRVEEKGYDELALLAHNINQMSDALEREIEAERRAEKTKNELITNVSHDLRTPLTIVMGYLRVLKDRRFENDEQYSEFVDVAYEKSEKLAALIEDLFEYTKLSNQGVRVNSTRVWLNEMLEQLVEEFVTVGEESGVSFKRNITKERLMIEADPDQFTRVLENLLTNAIQHSHKPGEIEIDLVKDDECSVITVSNRGESIPEEEIPRLFERFYRPEPSRTSTSGGSGLGLAIAKSIVELYQGTIHCECENSKIRFIVKLPLAKNTSEDSIYRETTSARRPFAASM